MDEYIEVKIDVFEHTAQRARLRKALTVSALIDEIFKEFDDVAPDTSGRYSLYLKGSNRPLPGNATLTQLDIQPQDELIFNYSRQGNRQMLDPRSYAYLKDDTTGRVYEIQWQPALIGRPTNEAEHNIMLAVNLQMHPQGQTISRTHARITFNQGSFFIESMAANNPLSVNGKPVQVNSRRELKHGDRLLLGRNNLAMTFSTQAPVGVSPAAQESRPPAAEAARPQAVQDAQAAAGAWPQPPAPIAGSHQNERSPAVNEKTFTPPEGQPGAPQAASLNRPVPRLVIERALAANKLGQRLELTSTPFLLGRELPLLAGEGEISRRHAEINFDPRVGQYTITDTQSTNGVTLNGTRVEPNRPYELRSGTKIGLGANFLMRFEM